MTLRELELLVALMRKQADETGHEPVVTFQDMDTRGMPRLDLQVPLTANGVKSMTIDSVGKTQNHPNDRIGDILVGLVQIG